MSDARNYGLKYASGEYVSFIDSDDYVDIHMMEEMYNKVIDDKLDMVICNLDYVDEEEKVIKSLSVCLDKNIKMRDIKKYMLNFYPAACNKLYKKDLFKNGIKFKIGVWYEDVEFIHRVIPFVNSIGFVNKVLYHYVQRDGTITKTFDKRLYNYIDNWNGIIDFYKDRNLYNEYKNELEYCYVRYLFATFVKQATNYKDKREYDRAVDVAIKNVKEKFPNYRKNKYFYNNLKGIYLLCFNKFIAGIYYKIRNR